MVPAYTACSVLLTVLHSPQVYRVSVSHPDYNFELCCTEVTMSQKHLLPLLKIANYGNVPFHFSSPLQAESTKIRLKCQAGEGLLDPSLEKEWEWRGKKKEQGILHHLRRWGEMVWQVPGPNVPVGQGSKIMWTDCWGTGSQVYPVCVLRACFETFLLISLKSDAFFFQIINSQDIM